MNQVRAWWSHRSGTERLEISFQGVVALATVAYVTIASFQGRQMKAATKQTRRAANAAKSAADIAAATLKATTEQFQTDERPYLVAEYIRLDAKPALGEKLAADYPVAEYRTNPCHTPPSVSEKLTFSNKNRPQRMNGHCWQENIRDI
jgi:hypothetical protein